MLLLAGVFSAIQQRVGNVQRWAEVATFFTTIRSKCFSVISSVMKDNPWYQVCFIIIILFDNSYLLFLRSTSGMSLLIPFTRTF